MTTRLVRKVQALGVPVIYFGVNTATLLPAMRETGADVIGLDWRVPLDQGWSALGHGVAVQGNLDPILLFALRRICSASGCARFSSKPADGQDTSSISATASSPARRLKMCSEWCSTCANTGPLTEVIPVPDNASPRQAVLLLAHGTPQSLDEIPEYLEQCHRGRPCPNL